MVNDAAKYSLGVAAFGVLAAVAYRIGGGDRAGALVLAVVAIAAAIVAFGVATVVGPDRAPFVAADTEPSSYVPDVAELPRRSAMPLLAAAGTTMAFAGGALGSEAVVAGLIVAALGFGGWLAESWRTHPAFNRRDAVNLEDRLLGPVALPVVAFLVTAVIAVSFSRVLLAVSATASWVIALLVAAAVLAVLWVLAHRGTTPKAGRGLAAAGALAVLLAGGAGAAAGQREYHPHHDSDVVVAELIAKDVEFDEDTIELPAGRDAEIEFVNRDDGVNHNVAIYTSDEPGTPLFNGAPILSGDITYKLRTPDQGVYRYICDFHPNMVGTLNVVKSANEPHKGEPGETEH